jgi:hypothetical protein
MAAHFHNERMPREDPAQVHLNRGDFSRQYQGSAQPADGAGEAIAWT